MVLEGLPESAIPPLRGIAEALRQGNDRMASTALHEFTDANFATDAMQSDQPVLIDFWAEWCGPCRMLAPVIEELAGEYEGRARIGKLDVDSNREVATQFGIMSIPTVIILKNGEIAKKFVGMAQKAEMVAALDEAM
ncbi:MAG: thioredoxin [Planctomycetota bacterium]|nr:thioredoxin [Planctomycetota bacterium]